MFSFIHLGVKISGKLIADRKHALGTIMSSYSISYDCANQDVVGAIEEEIFHVESVPLALVLRILKLGFREENHLILS